jgi:hypothetical protein
MDKLGFYPEFTVADVLENNSGAARVFIGNKTACLGCYLARFCTLKDVAKTYSLKLEEFIEQLGEAVQSIKTRSEA